MIFSSLSFHTLSKEEIKLRENDNVTCLKILKTNLSIFSLLLLTHVITCDFHTTLKSHLMEIE